MSKFKIKLNDFGQIQNFIKVMWDVEEDSIIRSEDRKYAVDAKSIMGIFALDITSPIKVVAATNDATPFFAAIEQFVVK